MESLNEFRVVTVPKEGLANKLSAVELGDMEKKNFIPLTPESFPVI